MSPQYLRGLVFFADDQVPLDQAEVFFALVSHFAHFEQVLVLVQFPLHSECVGLELLDPLHGPDVDFELVLLALERVLHLDAGVCEHHHGLVGVHPLLEIPQDLPDLESGHLVQMMKHDIHLLLLVVALAHLAGTLLGQLPVVVVQVRGLADVPLVVLAHRQLLDEPFLVVLLAVENRGQQPFLCIGLTVDIVLLLQPALHNLQVALQDQQWRLQPHSEVDLKKVAQNQLILLIGLLHFLAVLDGDFVADKKHELAHESAESLAVLSFDSEIPHALVLEQVDQVLNVVLEFALIHDVVGDVLDDVHVLLNQDVQLFVFVAHRF